MGPEDGARPGEGGAGKEAGLSASTDCTSTSAVRACSSNNALRASTSARIQLNCRASKPTRSPPMPTTRIVVRLCCMP